MTSPGAASILVQVQASLIGILVSVCITLLKRFKITPTEPLIHVLNVTFGGILSAVIAYLNTGDWKQALIAGLNGWWAAFGFHETLGAKLES